MIRIDHIMAFTRLYWIPKDMPPQSGTYVKYSMHELLSIVALESVRNECVVVGEDLGTVPEQFRIKLNQRAVLSYKVFLFMKEHDGSFVSSDKYPDNVLVTATTHDLPTLRGYWNGDDLRIKQDLNLFESASQDEVFRIQRDRDRKEIIELLYSSDLLSSKEVPETFNKELFLAVHKFLNDTPAKLFVITLEDIAGQSEQVNIPGIVDDYPSWRVKTPVSIEKIGDLATFQSLVSHVLPLQRA